MIRKSMPIVNIVIGSRLVVKHFIEMHMVLVVLGCIRYYVMYVDVWSPLCGALWTRVYIIL